LFAAQAVRTHDAVAVAQGEAQLSYGVLGWRANQLAHYLRGLGMGSELSVGLFLERSPEMMVGLLGILKAGPTSKPLSTNRFRVCSTSERQSPCDNFVFVHNALWDYVAGLTMPSTCTLRTHEARS
jgi:non-ribosomal peptide synthetase component F